MNERESRQKVSKRSKMRRRKTPTNIELRIIAELMKNSRRSDREISRALRTSQPRVSRLIKKLEKEGYIKEYTIIPDFKRLGYQIMNLSMFTLLATNEEQQVELKRAASKMDRESTFANMIVARGLGMGKNRVFVTFFRDYDEYTRNMKEVKNLPNVNIDSLESFLIDLTDDFSYRILSMKQIARSIVNSGGNGP